MRAIGDYGQIVTWDFGAHENSDDAIAFINKYILPYVAVSKRPEAYNGSNWKNKYYYLNGTEKSFDTSYVRFYLSDGTSITAQMNTQSGSRLKIWIDINGDQKPNKCGKDIFLFSYWKSSIGFIANSINHDRDYLISPSSSLSCLKQKSGERCSALIIKDGWQIKDDYPW